MQMLVTFLLFPLMLLNILGRPAKVLGLFGGIVSGTELAVLGEWRAILIGVLMSLFAHCGILILFGIAGMLAGGLGLNKLGKELDKDEPTFLFMVFCLACTLLIVGAWCLLVFHFFLSHADAETVGPSLMWSYGAVLGPLMYMTAKARRMAPERVVTHTWEPWDVWSLRPKVEIPYAYCSIISGRFAQLAYITIAIVAIFMPITFFDLAQIFGCVVAIGLLSLLTCAVAMSLEQKRQRSLPG